MGPHRALSFIFAHRGASDLANVLRLTLSSKRSSYLSWAPASAFQVVQYGYVAMFAAAWPWATLVAAVANFVELRTDAFKLGYQLRRPHYWGAQDIGTWQQVSCYEGTLAESYARSRRGHTHVYIRYRSVLHSLCSCSCISVPAHSQASERAGRRHPPCALHSCHVGTSRIRSPPRFCV